jgi:hypothetical protein
MALSWGAAKNGPHCWKEAPDGKFHPLPARHVLERLCELGMVVRLFGYEPRWGGGIGEVALVAFKPDLDDLIPEDDVPYAQEASES